MIDFKRLTLLDAKYDRTRPSWYQALERLYSCCNCGKRWHVSLSRKWPTDPLPEHEWWVEPPSSTTPLRGALDTSGAAQRAARRAPGLASRPQGQLMQAIGTAACSITADAVVARPLSSTHPPEPS